MYGKHGYTLRLPDGTTYRTDQYDKAVGMVKYHWPDAIEAMSYNVLSGGRRTCFQSASTGVYVAVIREVYE